jgi:hypothetical protein
VVTADAYTPQLAHVEILASGYVSGRLINQGVFVVESIQPEKG